MKKLLITFLSLTLLAILTVLGLKIYDDLQINNKNNKIDDVKQEEVKPSIYDSYSEEEVNYLNNLIGLDHYNEANIDRYLKYINNTKYSYEEVIRVVNTNSDLEYFTDSIPANVEDDTLILVNKYNYLSEYYEPNDLELINSSYSYWGSLRRPANEAFLKMAKDVAAEGLKIVNTSPYRNYKLQSGLYNGYVNESGVVVADKFSARPGYSEHQTGLATDIITPTSNFDTFKNTKEFTWLSNNAYKYGFILRYGENMEYITGYEYEPWHYRYVGVDAATFIYEHNLTFEEYYYYYVKNK